MNWYEVLGVMDDGAQIYSEKVIVAADGPSEAVDRAKKHYVGVPMKFFTPQSVLRLTRIKCMHCMLEEPFRFRIKL